MEPSLADDTTKNDLAIEPEGAGLGFRTEVWFTDFLLRHYRTLLGIVGVILVAALVYGQWRNLVQSNQRATTSAIADVEGKLPVPIASLSRIKAMGEAAKSLAVEDAKVRESAEKILAVAEGASGTARVEGALKAAELYRLIGDNAGRRKALTLARDNATDVLRYAVLSGLASLELDEGKSDDALALLRDLATDNTVLGRRATLDLAATLESLDRAPDAVKVYDDFLTRWPSAPEATDATERKARASGQGG